MKKGDKLNAAMARQPASPKVGASSKPGRQNAAVAAVAKAQGLPSLSSKQKRLLERQASLLKHIQQTGIVGVARAADASPAEKAGKSAVQEIATRVGIWTATGKLSSSYKK